MPHSLVLEKGRPHPDELRLPIPQPPAAGSNQESFVYMLLPHAQGYQVMRAPLKQLLEISEAVSAVPHGESGAGDPGGGAAIDTGTQVRPAGFRLEDIVRMQGVVERESGPGWVRFGDIGINAAARVVTRAGRSVPLAPLEFDLLVALFQRKGAAASREELMREIWTGKAGVTSRTVDTHMFNLRRKLEEDPSQPVHLLTVSKIGYRLKA